MSWIENKYSRYRLRNVNYNSIVCLPKSSITKITNVIDTIFGDYTGLKEEISSLILYPISIKPYTYESGNNFLKTSKGVNSGITAYNISWYANYLTLGEFYVKNKYNNFIDYKGYTVIKVFLPFLGFVDVDVNECMGKWLQFRLYIDFYSGKGTYIIGVSDNKIYHNESPYVYDNEDDDMRILSTYECDIGIEIPLGSSNVGDIKRNLLLGSVKTLASMGFASYTNSLPPSTSTRTVEDVSIASSRGDYKGAKMIPRSSTVNTSTSTTTYNKPINKSKPYEEAFDGSIDILNRSFPHYSSDRINDSGLLWQLSNNIQVVIYRPKILPTSSEYNHLYGKPLGEIKTLSDIRGYTEVSRIHFENENFGGCTSYEYSMIEQLFTNGVILPDYRTPPGLYDADDNLVASWETLTTVYGMDCEKDYSQSNYDTDPTNPYYVLKNNYNLRRGSKLIFDDSINKIGSSTFFKCKSLTNIEIPNTVKSIGSDAFNQCTSLTSVIIPNSVTKIYGFAFNSCDSLESVVIGTSVTTINNYAFSYCPKLTSIEIPPSLTSVGSTSFSGCYSLIEVCNKSNLNIVAGSTDNGEIGYYAKHIITDKSESALKYVGDYVFYDDGTEIYLVKYLGNETEITLPNYYDINDISRFYKIWNYAFYRYENITSVVIPDSVTSIGEYAFNDCFSLISISIPFFVTSIGEGAFSDCSSLNNIRLPDYITTISDHLFFRCISLTNIEIPNTVTSIGEYAFYSCDLLTNIEIPAFVTSIGNSAFYDCISLKDITFNGTMEQWNAIDKGTSLYINAPATYVKCTDGNVDI